MATINSKIDWTQSTWNPLRGCSRISEGCRNCYAERMAGRFSGEGLPFAGYVRKSPSGYHWTGKVDLIEAALDKPRKWATPRRIFVNSMSDLFHEDVPDATIDRIVNVMRETPQHVYQILTKRADRLPLYHPPGGIWPSNVWLGVSIESAEHLDRLDRLRETSATVKWMSAEPLIAPLTGLDLTDIDWVVIGGESGAGHRQMSLSWAREILAACRASDVACFVKQMGTGFGGTTTKANDPDAWPEDLRVRQYPIDGTTTKAKKPDVGQEGPQVRRPPLGGAKAADNLFTGVSLPRVIAVLQDAFDDVDHDPQHAKSKILFAMSGVAHLAGEPGATECLLASLELAADAPRHAVH
jgi:protein gp37